MKSLKGKVLVKMKRNSPTFSIVVKTFNLMEKFQSKNTNGRTSINLESLAFSIQFKQGMNGTNTIKLTMMSIILLPRLCKGINSTFSTPTSLIRQKLLNTI